MIRKLIVAALLTSAAPVAAAQAPAQVPVQTPAPTPGPPAPPAAVATPDPARLAAARRFVDASMPLSLFEQAMQAGIRSAGAERSGNAELARRDPHHEERMRLEQRVMEEESARILRDLDPSLRALLADMYARNLTAAELEAAADFYASPAGRRLSAGAVTVATSEDYNKSMEALEPHFEGALAGAEHRFAAATAGLPPIPGMPAPPALPAGAAPPAPPAPPAIALPARPGPAADPARLAAARRALDALWPTEVFRHRLDLQPAVETLIAIRVGDFGVPIPPDAGINPNATLGEIGSGFDPHLRQRLPVLTRFVGGELLRMTTAMEPGWKLITADAYAREFTAAELDEVTGFFSSPAGRNLALASYKLLEDPQLVRGVVMLIPRVAMQFPAMNQRMAQATAHLPPVPAPPGAAPPAARGEAGEERDED